MAKMCTPAMEKLRRKQGSKPRKTDPWHEAWYRFRRNRAAMVSLAILLVMILFALFPSFFARYGEDEQIYKDAFIKPCLEHPLGTDNFGRDILSRIIWGTRTSLLIGISSVIVSLVLGGMCGLIAAFYGGKVDNTIMRLMDVLYALPSLLLAIAIAAALGSGMRNVILAIAVSQIPSFARVVRAAALTVRNQEYIEAARSSGSSPLRLMFRHMLPNCLATIIVQATLGVAGAIISGASLSFVGVGVQPPTAEWGYMLSSARQYIRQAWWIITFPGIAIMIAIFTLNTLGDGLRDAMDPKMKR
ncbi:MAG: ABC transporter permease [Clostridia bacterium]|nr:ABC transporter permease [Clostridia bacterium]